MSSFEYVGYFASFILLVVYIGIPLVVIFLLKWIYQIKSNSDLKIELDKEKIEQNNEIIQLLRRQS